MINMISFLQNMGLPLVEAIRQKKSAKRAWYKMLLLEEIRTQREHPWLIPEPELIRELRRKAGLNHKRNRRARS